MAYYLMAMREEIDPVIEYIYKYTVYKTLEKNQHYTTV